MHKLLLAQLLLWLLLMLLFQLPLPQLLCQEMKFPNVVGICNHSASLPEDPTPPFLPGDQASLAPIAAS